jgi:hypothetical protein
MNFQVQELYESVLITEMNQKVINYLEQHTDELPFDHIFGDKMRVAFPIGTDITAQNIIDDLRRIKNFDKVDLKKGEVIRKLKIDPKYGKGDYQEQKINIGRAISALKIVEDKKKKYLDWFARYKDNLEAAFEKPEYVVVLSRSPIDVVRMSDHRNISSCHSQGGSYFYCAIQEAITGGAVAYVVNAQDFDELTEEEFQNDEIFVDPDRGVRGAGYGLRPLSRLRVRRLEDDEGNEVAIPDTKIYGNQSIPNFYNSLKNYLQNKQSITAGDFTGQYEKRGGTYYDDQIEELLGNYFSDEDNKYYHQDFPRVKHNRDDDRGETRHNALSIEDDLRNIKDRYEGQMTHSSADYYIFDDDDDRSYFDMSGYSQLDISKFNLPDDIDIEIEDEYSIRKWVEGNYDDNYEYSALIQYLKDASEIQIYRIEMDNQSIKITFNDQETSSDPDNFDYFCRNMKRFDDKIDDMLDDEDELFEVFLTAGFIKPAEIDDKNFTMIKNYIDLEEEPFTHLSISGHDIRKSFTVKFPNRIFVMQGDDNAIRDIKGYIGESHVKRVLNDIIINLARETFKPESDEYDTAQLQFDKFFESYTNPLDGIDYSLSCNPHDNYGNLEISNMRLNFPKMDNRNYQFVEFLDDMYLHIINTFKVWVLNILKFTNNSSFEALANQYNYKQLYKLYNKYL